MRAAFSDCLISASINWRRRKPASWREPSASVNNQRSICSRTPGNSVIAPELQARRIILKTQAFRRRQTEPHLGGRSCGRTGQHCAQRTFSPREDRSIEFPDTTVLIRGPRERSHPTEHTSASPRRRTQRITNRRSSRNVRPLIDLEDHCIQTVASSVAMREIPHVAIVALQECLPEGHGIELDLGNQRLFGDHRI
jgi:hypothetical protein